jgi:hypothetical protein
MSKSINRVNFATKIQGMKKIAVVGAGQIRTKRFSGKSH